MRIILQVVLAVITGLNTAIPLILDAQQLFPSWRWQVHALIGFIAFVFVMIWIVLSYSIPLNRIENIKPNLKVKDIKSFHQLYQNGNPVYGVLQVWLTNEPRLALEASTAKDVTATITFYDRKTKKTLELSGCFTTPEALDYATVRDLKDTIDIWPPNATPQKLLVALKYPNDEDAYGITRSNFLATQGGRQTGNEIKKGTHYLKLILKGIAIDQRPLWFTLTNLGRDGDLALVEIKKPDLHKEGFQAQ